MSLYKIIVWDNAGNRSVDAGAEKIADAKKHRTARNRTVKVADAFGTVAHWSRSHGNHWSHRAVAGPCSA